MEKTESDYVDIEVNGKRLNVDLSGQNRVVVIDRNGHKIDFQMVDGVYYAEIMKTKYLKERKSFELRPDDIYFPGYPRTGTHWTFEMASMLLKGKPETIERFKDHMEYVSPEEFSKLPSPRIVNCHFKLSDAPDDVKLKKVKIMYTLRDPKDVAVSLYKVYSHKAHAEKGYKGSFEDYLHLFLEGKVDYNGIFEHWRDADKFFDDNPDIPVFIQRYEDTLKDPVVAVQKISDFLGLPRNEDLCRAIADKCEISKMKVDKDKYSFKFDGENILYRKGTSGDWRNYFTDDMLDDYYRVYDEKLAGTKFHELYSRDKD